LLAVELLLFEFRPRSLIPVALASATATGIHVMIEGLEPVFAMPDLGQPGGLALAAYIAMGAVMGVAAVLVTRITYAIEDAFEHLPIHWMWWPAVGAVVVGVVGYFAPATLGVGYENISHIISDNLALSAVVYLCLLKFISWSVALGSGTSGGTLAPLFTIGSGIGAVLGAGAAWLAPALGIDVRVAALVGMAAIFAGASRAMLASAVFAFETTLQPMGLLPLLGGCAASYLVASLLMRTSIMTEKIVRRGIRTPEEYLPDPLDQVLVRNIGARNVVTLRAQETLDSVRRWLAEEAAGTTHQGFPVLNENGALVGVVTRRDLLEPSTDPRRRIQDLIKRPVKFVYDDCTVRQAADHMVNHSVGRLPVVERAKPHRLVGIISRSDILSVYGHRIRERTAEEPSIRLHELWRPSRPAAPKAS
jgi:CBS domain-containing protein